MVQGRQYNIAIFEIVIKFNKYKIIGTSLFYISIFMFKNLNKKYKKNWVKVVNIILQYLKLKKNSQFGSGLLLQYFYI